MFGAGQFFVLGATPWHCRVLSSPPGLYPLDVNSTCSLSITTQGVSRHGYVSLGEQSGGKITPSSS